MKIMSCIVPAAQVAAMTPNISWYIDRKGNLQSSLAATPILSTVYPSDPMDLSIYQHLKLTVTSAAQTGAAGGSFQLWEIQPNTANTATLTGASAATAGSIVQTINATATKFVSDIYDLNTPSATVSLRMFLAVPILFFTTVPSPGGVIAIELWGQTAASQYG